MTCRLAEEVHRKTVLLPIVTLYVAYVCEEEDGFYYLTMAGFLKKHPSLLTLSITRLLYHEVTRVVISEP